MPTTYLNVSNVLRARTVHASASASASTSSASPSLVPSVASVLGKRRVAASRDDDVRMHSDFLPPSDGVRPEEIPQPGEADRNSLPGEYLAGLGSNMHNPYHRLKLGDMPSQIVRACAIVGETKFQEEMAKRSSSYPRQLDTLIEAADTGRSLNMPSLGVMSQLAPDGGLQAAQSLDAIMGTGYDNIARFRGQDLNTIMQNMRFVDEAMPTDMDTFPRTNRLQLQRIMHRLSSSDLFLLHTMAPLQIMKFVPDMWVMSQVIFHDAWLHPWNYLADRMQATYEKTETRSYTQKRGIRAQIPIHTLTEPSGPMHWAAQLEQMSLATERTMSVLVQDALIHNAITSGDMRYNPIVHDNKTTEDQRTDLELQFKRCGGVQKQDVGMAALVEHLAKYFRKQERGLDTSSLVFYGVPDMIEVVNSSAQKTLFNSIGVLQRPKVGQSWDDMTSQFSSSFRFLPFTSNVTPRGEEIKTITSQFRWAEYMVIPGNAFERQVQYINETTETVETMFFEAAFSDAFGDGGEDRFKDIIRRYYERKDAAATPYDFYQNIVGTSSTFTDANRNAVREILNDNKETPWVEFVNTMCKNHRDIPLGFDLALVGQMSAIASMLIAAVPGAETMVAMIGNMDTSMGFDAIAKSIVASFDCKMGVQVRRPQNIQGMMAAYLHSINPVAHGDKCFHVNELQNVFWDSKHNTGEAKGHFVVMPLFPGEIIKSSAPPSVISMTGQFPGVHAISSEANHFKIGGVFKNAIFGDMDYQPLQHSGVFEDLDASERYMPHFAARAQYAVVKTAEDGKAVEKTTWFLGMGPRGPHVGTGMRGEWRSNKVLQYPSYILPYLNRQKLQFSVDTLV